MGLEQTLSTGGIQRLGEDHSIYPEFRARQARCKTDVAALALPLEPPGMPLSAGKRWAGRQAIQQCLLFISVLMAITSKTWLLLVLLLMLL